MIFAWVLVIFWGLAVLFVSALLWKEIWDNLKK